MRSLRSRFLTVVLLAILFNTVLLITTAMWGHEWAGREWSRTVMEESTERLVMTTAALYCRSGRLTPSVCRDSMENISRFADELAAFAVYDADLAPVHLWRNRDYLGVTPDLSLQPETPVLVDGEIVGWVACLPSDFSFLEPNKGMADRMLRILIPGMLLSILAAVALSFRLSAYATRDARVLASLLSKLSRGERELPFPALGGMEFQAISRAASRLQDTLTREERKRRQWTQDIAHDLRTPVAALQSQLEAVKDGVLELTDERYAALEREFSQIDTLVRDLSLLSRVESPEMEPVIRKLEARSFIEPIAGRFRGEAEAAGLELKTDIPDKLVLLADPDLMERVLNNLLQNAVHHAGAEGTVCLRATESGEGAAVTVENPGFIPESHLPYLFERLYRGDAGRSTPGSGLGLTIVRAVADKLGAEVSARNTSRGTVRIRFVLPHRGD